MTYLIRQFQTDFSTSIFTCIDNGIDSGFASDILPILAKYNILDHLHNYVHALQIPEKLSRKNC